MPTWVHRVAVLVAMLVCHAGVGDSSVERSPLAPLGERPAAVDQRGVVVWAASESQPATEGHEPAADDDTHAESEDEAHGPGPWSLVGRLVNFVILVGVLFYFLRAPVTAYLEERGEQVRRDLDEAAAMKESARTQLDELERRMAALPGEIDGLKARGAEEIAAEEERIRRETAAERERFLEQARRDIDLQLRTAKRELVEHAANLAVEAAAGRIKATITEADQDRLVDRYLQQVESQRE